MSWDRRDHTGRMPTRRVARLLAVVLVLAGCARPATAGPVTISLLLATRQPDVSRALSDGFRAGVAQVPGVRSVVVGPEVVDGSAAAGMLTELTRATPNGIAVWDLTPSLLFDPLREAARTGIPLIAVDTPPADPTAVPLFVGNDNVELGRELARLVVAQLNPRPTSGSIVLGCPVPGVSSLDQRATGLRAEFQRLLPGVRVLGPFDSRPEQTANLDAWRVLVAGHPEALAFVGTGDSDSVNLGRIRRETPGAGWLGAGFGLDPRALAAVQRAELVLVSPEQFLTGAVAGRLQAAHAAGAASMPTGWIVTPSRPVDRTNVTTIMERERSAETRLRAVQAQLDGILTHLPAVTRPLTAAR